MNKTKILSLLSNLAILANLVAGFLHIHWAIIPVFFVIHAVLRLAYLKAESQNQAIDPTKTQTAIAPPVIRNLASVITAIILAGLLYGIGYGIGYFVK